MAKSDNWSTPPDLMKMLDKEFLFDLEVCASEDNRALLTPYMGLDNGLDALTHHWDSGSEGASLILPVNCITYCNPPYSMLPSFAAKAGDEMELGRTNVLLIPAYVGTNYWQDDILRRAYEVRLLKGRLTFWENGKPGPYPARFDSAVVIYRPVKGLKGATIREWDWKA